MSSFKHLMTACGQSEMEYLIIKYDGLFEFAKFLENFATNLEDGFNLR